MVDVHAALGGAGLRNVHVREYVRYWADLTGAARIEVISTSDDARLIGEALADGEILPAGEGRYYSRSYVKDTALGGTHGRRDEQPRRQGRLQQLAPGRRDAPAG